MVQLRCRRAGAAACAALAATLVLSTATAGAAGFAPGTPFPADATPWGSLSPGFTSDGTMLAGHTDLLSFTNPVSSNLVLARRPHGQGWTSEFTLASTATNVPAAPPDLKVAPDGSAVAVWLSLDGPNPATAGSRVQATYRSPAGVWEAPATLHTYAPGAGGLALNVVMAPTGVATVLVGRRQTSPAPPSPVEIHDAITHTAAGWSAPVQVTTTSLNAQDATMGVDDAGNVTAVWRQQVGGAATPTTADDRYKIVARQRPAGGAWAAPTDVFAATAGPPGSTWCTPRFAVAGDGHAVIAAQDCGSTLQVSAARRGAAVGTFAAPQQVVNTGSTSSPMAAGGSPDGTAYLLLKHQGSSSAEDATEMIRAAPGGAWSAPQAVAAPGQLAASGEIAFAGSDAVAVWDHGSGSPVGVQAAAWPAGAAAPTAQTDLAGPKNNVDVAVPDRQGNVVILEENSGTQTQHVYDATPPAVGGAQVPATAVVGVAYQASIALGDLWSSLAAPTWSFGDGSAPASGAAVTHVFTAPGSLTITVHAADVLGNARDVTFPVTVSRDAVAPTAAISLPACGAKLGRKACARLRGRSRAWRTLAGTAADAAPSSGLAAVQINAYRRSGRRYVAWVGTRLKAVRRAKARSAVHPATLTPAGTWTAKLPALPPGTWTLRARAVDHAGNTGAYVTRTATIR